MQLFGCAGMIAAVGFVGVFVFSFVFSFCVNFRLSLAERFGNALLFAGMTAGMAFLASLILMLRDSAKQSAGLGNVRTWLKARDDLSEDEFCNSLPQVDPAVLRSMRTAVADIFGVPPEKIRPDDRFLEDYESLTLEPFLQCTIVDSAMSALEIAPLNYSFNPRKYSDFAALAFRVERLILRARTGSAETPDDETM